MISTFKKSLLLLLLVITFSFTNLFSQDRLDQIRKQYYSNYSGFISDHVLFGKKLNDWYVNIYNSQTEDYDSYLFWDSNKGSYADLGKLDVFVKIDSSSTDGSNKLPSIGRFQQYLFTVMPYYNYRGWARDNIKHYQGKELSLNDHYVLARSYSSYANSFLSDQYANSDKVNLPEETYLKPGDAPKNSVEQFSIFCDSAIYHYQEIIQEDPNYDTRIVGTAKIKWANEHIYRALTIDMNTVNRKPFSQLPNNLYTPGIIKYSKRFLDACPKNAILYVEGDNDTYPLIYLIEKLGYRKDITLINRSLLGLSLYSNYLKMKYNLSSSFDFNRATDRRLLFALRDKGSQKSCELAALIQKMVLDLKSSSSRPMDYDCRNLIIDGTTVILLNNYMLRNELNELDIIYRYKDKRPICYSVTCDSSRLMGSFIPNAIDRGHVYLLQFRKNKLGEKEKFDEKLVKKMFDKNALNNKRTNEDLEWFELQGMKEDLLRWVNYIASGNSRYNATKVFRLYKSIILTHEYPITNQDILIFDKLLPILKYTDVINEFRKAKNRIENADNFYTPSYDKLLKYYNRVAIRNELD